MLSGLSCADIYRPVQKLYQRYSSQSIQIDEHCIKQLQDLLDALGIPWLKAATEADLACAWLTHHGHVRAVLSDDSDQLALRAPIFIKKILIDEEVAEIIVFEELLTALRLTAEQFVHFCTLIGTDYAQRLTGMGPTKVFKLIAAHKSIVAIAKEEPAVSKFIDILKEFEIPDIDSYLTLFEGPIKSFNKGPIQRDRLEEILRDIESIHTINSLIKPMYTPKIILDLKISN